MAGDGSDRLGIRREHATPHRLATRGRPAREKKKGSSPCRRRSGFRRAQPPGPGRLSISESGFPGMRRYRRCGRTPPSPQKPHNDLPKQWNSFPVGGLRLPESRGATPRNTSAGSGCNQRHRTQRRRSLVEGALGYYMSADRVDRQAGTPRPGRR